MKSLKEFQFLLVEQAIFQHHRVYLPIAETVHGETALCEKGYRGGLQRMRCDPATPVLKALLDIDDVVDLFSSDVPADQLSPYTPSALPAAAQTFAPRGTMRRNNDIR